MAEPYPVQVLSVREQDDADAFLRQLVLSLSAQKRSSRAYGSTTIELLWREGELHMAEIRDAVTVKFSGKS